MHKDYYKKILIIGNGQSILNYTLHSKIDAFPIVARINNYKTPNFEKFIGSKTDIWFNGANQGLKKRMNLPSKIIIFIPSEIQGKKGIAHCNKLIKKRLKVSNYDLIPIDKICKLEKECGSNRLTTGTYSILWALSNFEKVYIHGFDFFIDSKSHYFDNPIIAKIKNIGIIPKAQKHDMVKEKHYIEELISKKVIRLFNVQ